MKTILKFLIAGAATAALSTTFTACNTSGGTSIVPVSPTDLPEEVSAFFEEHLPPVSGQYSDVFFVDEDGNKCLLINSIKELNAIMPSSLQPPSIDFDRCSLIIGQQTMTTTGFYVLHQSVDVRSNKTTLNLAVKIPVSNYAVFSNLYYWGLYPKLHKNNINVNVIYEK